MSLEGEWLCRKDDGIRTFTPSVRCRSRKSYPRVAVVQSRQNRYGDDGPGLLDGSSPRRILAQIQVRARVIVIERIRCQHPPQMPFAKDQNMIQAVAPERPDQALNAGVLPGRPRSDRAVPNPHRPDPLSERLPVGAIIVAHQVRR